MKSPIDLDFTVDPEDTPSSNVFGFSLFRAPLHVEKSKPPDTSDLVNLAWEV
jgi:hypothetical protein